MKGAPVPEVVWSDSKLSPDTPTPVAYEDRVYVLKDSILSCADLATGKPEWQMRLKCKQAYASPLAGNGHLYLADENGVLQTIELGGEKGKIASRLELGETIMCTPASLEKHSTCVAISTFGSLPRRIKGDLNGFFVKRP